MLKITHAERHKIAGRGNGYYPGHIIFCTDNHLVFTKERGFVRASELKECEHVQFENAHGQRTLKNIDGKIYAHVNKNASKCTVCGKICGSPSGLGSHMRTHDINYPGNNMSEEGHRVLSEHYRTLMDNPESRKKMAETLSRKMKSGEITCRYGGYIGNGTYTKQQLKLHNELLKHDERWTLEHPVSTGYSHKDDSNYPSNYKLDLAFPEHKIGVEVHGGAHTTPELQIKDKKKQDLLTSMGWLILEIWNDEIDTDMNFCVDKVLSSLVGRSPHWSEICKIEKIEYTEEYVYDIEVEDNHNFYAEGTLVHNCQDLNPAQIEIIKRVLKPDGCMIAVGDRFQSIYGFRGADSEAIPNIIDAMGAEVLPLSITYRCPLSHVRVAQTFVPEIEAAPHAEEGILKEINFEQMLDTIAPGDMALCRYNAPLVKPAFALLKEGVKVTIKGRDIGAGLVTLIKKLKPINIEDLIDKLGVWRSKEIKKARAKNKSIESIEDKVDVIFAFVDNVKDVPELIRFIFALFSDKNAAIVFSSIHKAKGLEADNVFVIQPQLMPSKYAVKAWENQQELNCQYVAYTRAKKSLYMVE